MNLSKLNEWISILANVGVLGGLIFLGMELNQNSLIAEREILVSQADNVNGPIVETDYLIPILLKVSNVQGVQPIVTEYMDIYDMTEEEATRWWRHLLQTWQHSQANWIYEGRDGSNCEIFTLQFLDHQILYKNMKFTLDPEFTACIDASGQLPN